MSNFSGRLIEVTISEPASIDLLILAESTAAAFELLFPLCGTPLNSSTTVKLLVTHARSYIKAIDYSIIAAQNGFNIAEEAINFSELVDARTGEADHADYLRGMWDMARKGHRNTQKAIDKFKSVRTTIEALIGKAITEQRTSQLDGNDINLDLNSLENNIHKLETFSDSVSRYISWWNFMEMSAEAQKARSEQLVFNHSSLREKSVIKKWEKMRGSYIDYKDKITLLQSKYKGYRWLSIKPEEDVKIWKRPTENPKRPDELMRRAAKKMVEKKRLEEVERQEAKKLEIVLGWERVRQDRQEEKRLVEAKRQELEMPMERRREDQHSAEETRDEKISQREERRREEILALQGGNRQDLDEGESVGQREKGWQIRLEAEAKQQEAEKHLEEVRRQEAKNSGCCSSCTIM